MFIYSVTYTSKIGLSVIYKLLILVYSDTLNTHPVFLRVRKGCVFLTKEETTTLSGDSKTTKSLLFGLFGLLFGLLSPFLGFGLKGFKDSEDPCL